MLDLPDMKRLFDRKAAVLEHTSKAIRRIFAPDKSEDCAATYRCQRALDERAGAFDDLLEYATMAGMGRIWVNEFRDEVRGGWKLCKQCVEMVDARDKEERRAFWDALPDIFDLVLEEWGTST